MIDRIALLFASGCLVGYVPGAPGTYASILTSLAFFGISRLTGGVAPELHISTICLVTVLGVLSSDRVSRATKQHDPSYVVIDEVAGQLASFLLVPVRPSFLVAGTLVFRALDIWKPFGIRRLESLEHGVGIMADDLAAGFLTCLLLGAGNWLFTLWYWYSQ